MAWSCILSRAQNLACEAGSVINYLIGKVAMETNQQFKIGPER